MMRCPTNGPEVATVEPIASRHAGRGRERAAWMARVQDGDVDAYRALLDDLGAEVMSFLRRRLPNRQEADDVYQDVLLAVHVSRHTYERGRPVEPWVFAIASHVLARHVRGSVRRNAHELLVGAPPSGAAPVGRASSRVEILEAFRRLPPRQREAVELLAAAGLRPQTAAARAGISAGALRVRVHRAYKTLRMLLLT
jgi:RNA polymerase sigma factor (sigma-70 family)